MMSGPSATFGIMLRLTRSGITNISSVRDQENNSAVPMPTIGGAPASETTMATPAAPEIATEMSAERVRRATLQMVVFNARATITHLTIVAIPAVMRNPKATPVIANRAVILDLELVGAGHGRAEL